MPELRIARIDDAESLAALAESTFRVSFAAFNTAEDMSRYCREHFGPSQQAAEIADTQSLTLLIEDVGSPVGYAQMRWGDAPSSVKAARPGEIRRLYLDRDWHGKGAAHALMDACLEALVVRGCDVAWLGVWEHNPRAIAFYRKHGFYGVGEQSFTLGSDRQRDIVMVRTLAKG